MTNRIAENNIEINLNENIKKNNKKNEIQFKASPLSISTCTVITNLNSKINLGFLSRFINIYEQNAPELDAKSGGAYNLEYYGNCARGETLIDKIKDEFNNQATLKFKYWGFRNINIKVFANGKLQMTGLKYEDEAKEVGSLLIEIIKNIKIPITTNINSLVDISKTYDFQLIYDPITKNVFYYRKYYDRFLNAYNFDTDLIYGLEHNHQQNQIFTPQLNLVNYKRKGFIEGIHDTYLDTLEINNQDFLIENEWSGDNYIKKIIDKIERLKNYFTGELEQVLTNSKTLKDVKINIELLKKKYNDFSFNQLDKLLYDIGKNMFSTDEQTLIDIKGEIFKFNRLYKHILEKKVNRLVTIRTIDITICSYIKEYLNKKNTEIANNNIVIPLLDLELEITKTNIPSNYFVSETETVLINSDLAINHNINLKKMSKVLRRAGLYNSYEPDEYPGVLTKYYYNLNNEIQGICNCTPHCSTKEKHSICTKITISVFRPGSVIITGARNLIQLMSAHDLIIKILKDNIEIIKSSDNNDDDNDNKQIALLNNEFRKISRKPRLFFIKKNNIINFDKIDNS